MSRDEAGVSEYVVGDDPRPSDAGPSTDPLLKLTNRPLQPIGVAVDASAAAAGVEAEQLPEWGGARGLMWCLMWWCPLKWRVMGYR
jgi:hypothetical protein